VKRLRFKLKVKREVLLGFGCLLVLAWNIALSTQRRNLYGEFFDVEVDDVELKVQCPGKIEPKIQKTIYSLINGKKLRTLVEVGMPVKKGQILMEISRDRIDAELNQKKYAARNAKSQFYKAKKDYQIEKDLFKQQAVSRRDVENARQTYKKAEQDWATANKAYAMTKKKEAGIEIRSPMDGVLLENLVEKTLYIGEKDELLKIAKLEKFAMRGQIDELNIAEIKVGQEAVLICDAYPDVELIGRVSWIGAQAREGAFAEIDVLIDIESTEGLQLKPNLSAEASIITQQIPNAIKIPSEAIQSQKSGSYVLVKRLGGWLVRKKIEISNSSGGEAIVTSGLSEGDVVLVPQEE